MKLQYKLLAVAAMAFGTCQFADAAVSFSVDLDSTLDGIQSEREIAIGESITAAIFFVSDNADPIAAYNFDVDFNPTSLAPGPNTLLGKSIDAINAGADADIATNRRQDTPHVIFGARIDLLGALTSDDVRDPSDAFGTVSAGNTGAPLNLAYSAPIFEFTLTGIAPSTSLDNNVTIGGEGVLFAGTGVVAPVFDDPRLTFNGARLSVAAVPEPSSLALLAAGLGVAGLRRRRK